MERRSKADSSGGGEGCYCPCPNHTEKPCACDCVKHPARAERWRLLTSAPRDGTLVLACRAGYKADDGGFSRGIQPCTVYYGTYHPNAPGKSEWRNARTRAREPHLTHWMPMPAPPAIPYTETA